MHLRPLLLTTLCLLALPAAVARAQGAPIMPLSQVHGGMDCIGETVVQGTTISQFGVHVIDVVVAPGQGTRILVSVSGPVVDTTGIAEGFSGSPVLCDDGTGTLRTIGAVSAGIGEYGNKVGLVTPIEQMLGEPVHPPVAAPRLAVRSQPLTGPLLVSGLSPALAHLAEQVGQAAGRPLLATPALTALSFPPQDLVPGASVGVAYSTGTVAIGGIGTVTYRDGDVVYAFGHPMDGAGRRSLLLQDAYVYDVVNNPNVTPTSYKLASFGHVLGTLTSDTPAAVIGSLGAPPATIPVSVQATDTDTGRTQTESTTVADETDIGFPLGSSLLDLVAPFAVAQAATDIYDGAPASESGRMCLRITVRESAVPLGFCNRYVSTGVPGGFSLLPPSLALSAAGDAATALALVDGASFAALHVAGVTISLEAARGLRQAKLISVTGPYAARAGARITLSMLVRDYRGPLRRIQAGVQVPRGVHGRVRVSLRGPAAASGLGGSGPSGAAGNVVRQLAAAVGGNHSGSGGSGAAASGPPTSLPTLRKAVAAIAVPDVVTVRFGRQRVAHLPRDPDVLVTGSAGFTLRVR